jgi:hypothetical protein
LLAKPPISCIWKLLWKKIEGKGRPLERRRREFFLSNLERERRRNYEDFAPKSLIYSLERKYLTFFIT